MSTKDRLYRSRLTVRWILANSTANLSCRDVKWRFEADQFGRCGMDLAHAKTIILRYDGELWTVSALSEPHYLLRSAEETSGDPYLHNTHWLLLCSRVHDASRDDPPASLVRCAPAKSGLGIMFRRDGHLHGRSNCRHSRRPT